MPPTTRGGFTTYYMDPDQPSTGVRQWNLMSTSANVVARAGCVAGYDLEQWAIFNQQPNNYIWFASTGKALPTGTYANVARRPSTRKRSAISSAIRNRAGRISTACSL